MAAGLKISVKNPFGGFKIKGTNPDKVMDAANQLRDLAPKPMDASDGVQLSDNSLPRVLRTSRQKPSIPFKMRYRGSQER